MLSHDLPPHGQYVLSLEGAVIRLRARGPWNREAVAEYRREFAELVDQIGEQPWGVLGVLQGEALLLPEAAALLKQHSSADTPRGRVATALILENVLLSDLVREQFSQVYQGQAQRARFFTDAEEARRWLDGELQRAREGLVQEIA